jgi:hypothetical protein
LASDLILEILGAFLGVGKATGCVTGGGPGIEVGAPEAHNPAPDLEEFAKIGRKLKWRQIVQPHEVHSTISVTTPTHFYLAFSSLIRSVRMRCRSKSVLYVIVTESPFFNPLSFAMNSLLL